MGLLELDALTARLGHGQDFLIFDTPGRDDEFARYAATTADTLVTPDDSRSAASKPG